VLSLFGRCGARQLFVAADPLSDAPAQQPEYREDPLLRPAASGLRGYGEKPGERPCIRLTFPRSDPSATRAMVVGCMTLADERSFPGGAGNFELEWEPSNTFFSANVSQGSVSPGARTTVAFSFRPPAVEETYGLDVGQWARTIVKVHLTGGMHTWGQLAYCLRADMKALLNVLLARLNIGIITYSRGLI
jgi:hypothetical protein